MTDLTLEQWKAVAEGLWQILDDINTLDDWAKNNDRAFRTRAVHYSEKRHRYATSDGYDLTDWRIPL